MATFVVTNNNDGGTGSLREAIASANANADADRIVFAAGLAGSTINLSGELVLTNTVTISGDINDDGDADVTISGTSSTNLLRVASGSTATLNSLKFADATTKLSVIRNDGTLTVNYSVFSGNEVRSDNDLMLNTSVGTVVNAGVLTMSQSVFDTNTALGGTGANGVYQDGFDGIDAGGAAVNLFGATLTLSRVAIIDGGAFAGAGGYGGNGYANGVGTPYAGYDGGDGGIWGGQVLWRIPLDFSSRSAHKRAP